MKQLLGHDGPPQGFWRENIVTDEPLAECPLRSILRTREAQPELARELDEHMDFFPQYERGVLLVAGGLGDQPARYIDLMKRIGVVRNAVAEKVRKTETPQE